MSTSEPWFAVRCLLSHPSRAEEGKVNLYEERITLWKSGTWEEAFRLAKEEALSYADDCDAKFIETTDSFHLFEKNPGHGSEVWSLMRDSFLAEETYLNAFCCTNRDRATQFVEPEDREE